MATVLLRKTNRKTAAAHAAGQTSLGRLSNHIGDVVAIMPDGHEWSATERAQFHVVQVSGMRRWHELLLTDWTDRPRRIRVRLAAALDGQSVTIADLLARCEDKDGAPLADEATILERFASRLRTDG